MWNWLIVRLSRNARIAIPRGLGGMDSGMATSSTGCKNRECRRQFGAGEHPSGRRFPYEVMADTVRWYYLGGSLRQAAAKVMDDHSIRDTVIATSTVRSWVQEYTDLAFEKNPGTQSKTAATVGF